MPESDAIETMTRAFHEAYERLAPDFGYKTREASAVPWDDVPEQNKALMRATVASLPADVHAQLAIDGGAMRKLTPDDVTTTVTFDGAGTPEAVRVDWGSSLWRLVDTQEDE